MNRYKAGMMVIASLTLGLLGWIIGSSIRLGMEIGIAAFFIPTIILVSDIHSKIKDISANQINKKE